MKRLFGKFVQTTPTLVLVTGARTAHAYDAPACSIPVPRASLNPSLDPSLNASLNLAEEVEEVIESHSRAMFEATRDAAIDRIRECLADRPAQLDNRAIEDDLVATIRNLDFTAHARNLR